MVLFFVGHVGVNGSQNAPELIYRDMKIQNFPGGACPQTPLGCGGLCPPLTVVHTGVIPTHNSPITKFLDLPLYIEPPEKSRAKNIRRLSR